jgi:hypothetical protein
MPTAPRPLEFGFIESEHAYVALDTGETLPSITQLLARAGLVDDRFFSEEASDRGTAVHRLCADHDLKALDVATCTSKFRGYLLAHIKAVSIIQPTWLAVEEARVHPVLRFGGRPDRDMIAYGQRGVWEIKSGVPSKAHSVQTAFQSLLVAVEANLPPESLLRLCCYVKDKGRYRVEEHKDRRDFDEAKRILREFANGR